MLGTKMRALFQRKKGRDLFDLYWALTTRSALPVSVDDVVLAFQHYMRDEHTRVPRAEFVAHLRDCVQDSAGFCTDMEPLLRAGSQYDPQEAARYVESHVLSRLPE
jgi:predicted nucleotidyltransferase component of viral defense system